MATKKLSSTSKLFFVIAAILVILFVFGGANTAQFFKPKASVPTGQCIGTHTFCANLTQGLNASQANVLCQSHGCNFSLATGCIGTPHSCNSFRTQSACQNEANYGCRWMLGTGNLSGTLA